MKSVFILCVLFASISQAGGFDRDEYAQELQRDSNTRVAILLVRDLLAVPRICGVDVVNLVFRNVDQAIAKTDKATSDETRAVIKNQLLNTVDDTLKLTNNSQCKDNVIRLVISVSEGLDRGMSASIKAGQEISKEVNSKK